MNFIDALLLGLVEGITEFLPVSSTGHLILARSLLGLEGEAVDRMLIVIQGAAILAICWEYRHRLTATVRQIGSSAEARRFTLNMFVAFLPLAVLGLLLEKSIERVLFSPIPVSIALVVGGALILWAERRTHRESILSVDELRVPDAVKLGFFQALALVPGTSRSAATILGGLLIGMSRRAATEFSFFLAIPTLIAATLYKLWEAREALTIDELGVLAVSSVAAFASALVTVRLFVRFVSGHTFTGFAWYRIVFGIAILLSWATGLVRW